MIWCSFVQKIKNKGQNLKNLIQIKELSVNIDKKPKTVYFSQ